MREEKGWLQQGVGCRGSEERWVLGVGQVGKGDTGEGRVVLHTGRGQGRWMVGMGWRRRAGGWGDGEAGMQGGW